MDSNESWQVEGNAAEVYESLLVPGILDPWATVLVEKADLHSGENVLDVACGTGVVARKAALAIGATGKVTGLDLNAGMLEVARSCASAAGASIEWEEGDAGELPFPEAQFDAVVCQLGLQFFPDQLQSLREMRRVLKPNGRVLLLVWRSIKRSPGFDAIAEALDGIGKPDASAIMRAPFIFGDETGTLRELIVEAGFRDISIRSEVRMVRFDSPDSLVTNYVGGSPMASHIAECSDDQQSTFTQNVREALGPYYNEGELAFPIEGHIAIGWK